MATTPNYGFVMPDPTDFVTDLPADFEIFGDEVDARIKALNPETTAGDLSYRGATANAKDRLAIGTAGQVLTVNSGATAPIWASPSSGGWTLLNTGGTTLTGASVSITSIPQVYRELKIVVHNYRPATDATRLCIRMNGDSTASRHFDQGTSVDVSAAFSYAATFTSISRANSNAANNSLMYATIPDYANTTTQKNVFCDSAGNGYQRGFGSYNQTDAITSLTFLPHTGNFTSGTVYLYGVV